MRISTQQIFTNGLSDLLRIQNGLVDIQSKISSGKRVETPADDPVAASQIQSVKQQIALTEQYNANATVAENKLSLAESSLTNITKAIYRLQELTIQAGDGAIGAADRAGITVEVQETLDQLQDLLNTRDGYNQYIFGGYASGTTPFVMDVNGNYIYQGDQGSLQLQLGSSLYVQVSDSGRDIFMDIDRPADINAALGASNSGTLSIDLQAVSDQQQFDQLFGNDQADITFSVSGGVTTYSITRVSDGQVLAMNQPYDPDIPIDFNGAYLELSGSPADGDTINIGSTSGSKMGLLDVVNQLAQGLDTLGDGDAAQLNELLADTLISLDGALTNVSVAQATIGARLNSLDQARNTNDDFELYANKLLSDIQDLDFTEALTKLSMQSFVLEAAQSSFVQINGLSLFNYLR